MSPSTALATFYKNVTAAPYGQVLMDALPILGKDGTLANVLTDSPAAGKVQMKTGNRVAGTAADQIIVLGNSLAGYIEAESGRRLTFMIGVSNVPFGTPAEFEQVTTDQARDGRRDPGGVLKRRARLMAVAGPVVASAVGSSRPTTAER